MAVGLIGGFICGKELNIRRHEEASWEHVALSFGSLICLALLIIGAVRIGLDGADARREYETLQQIAIAEHNEVFERFLSDTFDGRLPVDAIHTEHNTRTTSRPSGLFRNASVTETTTHYVTTSQVTQELANWLSGNYSDLALSDFLYKMRAGQIDLWGFV